MWSLRAERDGQPAIDERYERQGTAYRRARQLFAAGYSVSAVQFSVEEPPVPVGVYLFDGIRFVRIPKGRR
jgi:hypothetical protein